MSYGKSSADALQFEALLIGRMYLYQMFHHLCGGVPSAQLLDTVSDTVAQDVLEEYEVAADIAALKDLLVRYQEMDDSASAAFVNNAKDEYTRVFIGPGALPASPYESPYKGSHDMSLLQENTLSVRREYRESGMEPKRLHAVPDDHIAFMCSFMAKRAEAACELFEKGDLDALAIELSSQEQFIASHMLGWIDIFAESVATSEATFSDVLYPSVLKALAEFVKADYSFATEGAAWLSDDEPRAHDAEAEEATVEEDARGKAQQAFMKVKKAYAELCEIKQLGLEDYSFVQI